MFNNVFIIVVLKLIEKIKILINGILKMIIPFKLDTLLEQIKDSTNKENAGLIYKFYEYMKSSSSSENILLIILNLL
jgi:hypothetical protein